MALAERVRTSSAEHKGLRREVGFIGLIWASEGSIIGSGWLFGAQGALGTAGPAAIISWGIGGAAILVLALVHAELGGMYPVSGGTARFPHYAFGGAAGASFGWFSWLQAATVAPIEVLAMITYGQHYDFAQGWIKTRAARRCSPTRVWPSRCLMALMTAVNFLSVKKLANTNSAITWWKVGVPLLTIFVLAVSSRPATSPPRTGSTRTARRASSRPCRPAASSSRCSASSRPTSSPVRAATPGATYRAR